MISIRQATLEDIPILVDFQQRLAEETEGLKLNSDILRAGVVALLRDSSKGLYYIAEDDGRPVGCHMITYEWSDWRNGMVWWLQSVYVEKSSRQQGIFKKMYDNLISLIHHDKTIVGLRLYVDKTNVPAQQVYKAMGMDGSHYTVFEWMKA